MKAESVPLTKLDHAALFMDISEALGLLRTNRFPANTELTVLVQDRAVSFSPDQIASGVATRRLSGLSSVLAAMQQIPKPHLDVQNRKPVLHAGVAPILDALRNKD